MDMLKAIRANDIQKVQRKLLKGYDVNKQIQERNNNKKEVATIPICLAATHGYCEIVDMLLTYGANIHACNWDWSTPLHMATYHGHMEIVRCLIKRNVNLNNSDQQGNTVLHLAALKNNFEAAVLFLEYQVDADIRNNKGETAIDIARALQYEHIISIIVDQKKMTREQAANEDKKRVQAKQLMIEFTEKERVHKQMEDMKIQELNDLLNEKESVVSKTSNELHELNQEATSISAQIIQLEANLREINQLRVTKERVKTNSMEDIEELKRRIHMDSGGSSVTRSRSLKENGLNESSEYECPICYELPFSPKKVYQCGNGHVYCSDCKEKPGMKHCPQCRIPLDQKSAIRNIVYEDMLSKKQTRRSTAA